MTNSKAIETMMTKHNITTNRCLFCGMTVYNHPVVQLGMYENRLAHSVCPKPRSHKGKRDNEHTNA